MSSTAFIEPLPVIEFVAQLLNRDVSARPLSDSDRVKVGFICLSQECSKCFLYFLSPEMVHLDQVPFCISEQLFLLVFLSCGVIIYLFFYSVI